jgi:hypothetical protein
MYIDFPISIPIFHGKITIFGNGKIQLKPNLKNMYFNNNVDLGANF